VTIWIHNILNDFIDIEASNLLKRMIALPPLPTRYDERTHPIRKRLFEKSHSSLHSPPSPPILGGSEPQSPPKLGDLGGECNVFATFQTASNALEELAIALNLDDGYDLSGLVDILRSPFELRECDLLIVFWAFRTSSSSAWLTQYFVRRFRTLPQWLQCVQNLAHFNR
jgi:hypothetical protein